MGLRVSKQEKNANRRHDKNGAPATGVESVAGGVFNTIANKVSTLEKATAQEARAHRMQLRRRAREIRVLPRLMHCGHTPSGGGVALLRSSSGVASFDGLQSCGSVWSCPVCAVKIMKHRQGELRQAVKAWGDSGSIGLLTLTMRHNKGDALKDLWDGLSKAWKSVISGRNWQKLRTDFGLKHIVRAVEVTQGPNGWHVHMHALLFFDEILSPRLAEPIIFARIFERWEKALERLGFALPLTIAQDFRLVGSNDDGRYVAEYLAKMALQEARPKVWTVSEELTLSDMKNARKGHRKPFEILADAVDGDAESIGLWRDFEKSSKGRRALTWSRGMRDALGIGEELDDVAIMEEPETDQETDSTEIVFVLDSPDWKKLISMHPEAPEKLLRLAERSPDAARSWLSEFCVPYRTL